MATRRTEMDRRPIRRSHLLGRARRGIPYTLAAVSVAALVGPLLWMVLSSFKSDAETFATPLTLWPRSWTLDNYLSLAARPELVRFFLNSAVSATATTLLVVPIAAASAYALARLRPALGRLGDLTEHVSLVSYMVPSILLIVPSARVVNALGLSDTLAGLVIFYVAHFLPFGLWLMRSYLLGLPIEVEDAARVDGATRLRILSSVVLPQVLPGLAATAIFTFNGAWGEYLFASVLLQSGQNLTINAGVALLLGSTGVFSWGVLMAAGVFVAVPVIALSMGLQRYFVTGVGEGAVRA